MSINQTTKLPYASTDPSLHFNHSEPAKPDWRRVYIYLLKIGDYDSAQLVKMRNMISDECSDGDCLSCNFLWCVCEHHSSVQFRKEHPQIQSLVEAQLSREESEAA